MPDSSEVWLNSGTTLTYDNNFAIDNRNINLSGEAFFKVTRNEAVPLIVNLEELQVKVLGTEFNVEAFPKSKKINIALEKGCIELLPKNELFESVHIKPGELAQFDKTIQKLKVEKVAIKKYTLWKEGVLSFIDEPMEEVIKRLERRYNIKIEVSTPEILNFVFTATIKDENLKEVLDMMKFASDINYEVQYSHSPEISTKVILTN